MFNFFKSPVRRAIDAHIANRIKNAEIAYKSEVKNAEQTLANKKSVALAEFHKSIKVMNADHQTRKSQILNKRVADIFRGLFPTEVGHSNGTDEAIRTGGTLAAAPTTHE
mgnify:CR=1 FL=1